MSHYERINETIAVVGSYNQGCFIPKKFKWKNKIFTIQQITLQSDVKDGAVKKRYFSVIAGAECYRLEFNRDNEQWWLRELWVE